MVAVSVRETRRKLKTKKRVKKKNSSSCDLPTESTTAVEMAANTVEEENMSEEATEGAESLHNVKHVEETDDEEDSVSPELKHRKSGVLYFSRIPPKFTPSRLQEYFERYAPGLIGRVHCTRNKNAKTIENRFTEGWLEIKKKKAAKMLAARFDNTPVGGKKRDYTSSVLWNIKYLSSFKWVHLMEQLQYERAVSTHHMSAEIAQAKRIAAHFEEQVEKGRNLKRLEEKALKANGMWTKFQREIEQRKVFKAKRKKLKSSQAHSAAKDDEVLQMIFAE